MFPLLYKTIKSLPQYKSYESYLEKLLWKKSRTEEEQASVDQLIALIGEWDNVHGTVSPILPVAKPADPIKILETLMKERKMTAAGLSTTLGLSQSNMSDLLNYRKELSPEWIAKLCTVFNVTPEFFAGS